MFFAIWLFAPRIATVGQAASQNGLKLVILKSKMAILGPSWRQVGQLSAILALTWPILAPRCAPTDLQVEPQTRPKSHLGPSWRQEGRPGAPNHPWSSNFQGFDPNFRPHFRAYFHHLASIRSRTSSRRFGTVAALRAQRIGYNYMRICFFNICFCFSSIAPLT